MGQFQCDMMRYASYLVLLIALHQAAGEFCYWDGTPPGCNGRCPSGLRETFRDTVGDGGTCWTGTKARCCVTTIPGASCHWEGTSPFCASQCPPGYSEVTRDQSGDGRNCWTGEKLLCCNAGTLGILGNVVNNIGWAPHPLPVNLHRN